MVLRIKRYEFIILKDKLIVTSFHTTRKYRLKFSIKRWNPFTYISPAFRLFTRKFFPKYYFEHFTDDAGWHPCTICDHIGGAYIEYLPVCETCKKKYD